MERASGGSMSNTRVMSAERDENLAPSLRIVLPNLIFGLLIEFNTISIVPPHHMARRAAGFHAGQGK
jgi:hypothetical protein